MARSAGTVTRKATRRLVEISQIERSDNEVTGKIYHAVMEVYRSPDAERGKVPVRTSGGTVKTCVGVPFNTRADGAGKGWPQMFLAEIAPAQVHICVYNREHQAYVPWNWNDLWGRIELADDQEARLARANLVHYTQRLLGVG